MSILEVHDVSIRYMTGDFKDIGLKEYVMRKIKGEYHVNEFWADRNISFTLEKGDMLGIIGTNGAGKSTLLKAISGIMEPTEGWVRREGNIAALLELASGFDGDLTVRENTYLRGAMLGYTRKFMEEMYDKIIAFAELQDFQDRPFKQLSSGMKSRLAFSIASLVQPDILILDEVLSVGDGAFRKKSEAKMREIIQGGATTILVSHSIEQVRNMCNKVLWLHEGRQVAFGENVEEICNQYQDFLDSGKGSASKTDVSSVKKVAIDEKRTEETDDQNMQVITQNLQLRMICVLTLAITGLALMYMHSPLFIIWGVCALLFCVNCWSRKEELGKQIRSLFSVDARQNLIYSFLFVLLFAFIAYGFLFSNEFFSHDSVQQTFYSNSPWIFQFYLGIGRFIIPLYEVIKGPYSAPWVIGLLFVVWITFTCFFVIELFQFKGRLTVAMVCGLLCTNTALILTGATYIYCLDEYAFALLVSVVAAYCFCKVPHGEILGIFLVILSLGIYQTYFTVTLVLCFIFAMQRLTKNEPAAKVISSGLKQIGLLFVGFVIYFAIWTGLCMKFQVAKNRTDELVLGKGLSGIVVAIRNACVDYFKTLFNTNGLLGYAYATVNIFLIALLFWALFRLLQAKNIDRCNKCLVFILVLCAPLAFSSPKIILGGKASDLTGYACELLYIFVLMSVCWDEGNGEDTIKKGEIGKGRVIVVLLLSCIIYNNALFANQAYMKKDLEKTATISIVTRMIERIETLDGYSLYDTPVYIVGDFRFSTLNKGKMDVPYLETRTGLWYNYSATYNLVRYVTDYLNYPMNITVKPELADTDEVRDMPAFPATGSVKMIDGAAVIKLS